MIYEYDGDTTPFNIASLKRLLRQWQKEARETRLENPHECFISIHDFHPFKITMHCEFCSIWWSVLTPYRTYRGNKVAVYFENINDIVEFVATCVAIENNTYKGVTTRVIHDILYEAENALYSHIVYSDRKNSEDLNLDFFLEIPLKKRKVLLDADFSSCTGYRDIQYMLYASLYNKKEKCAKQKGNYSFRGFGNLWWFIPKEYLYDLHKVTPKEILAHYTQMENKTRRCYV